MKTVILLMGLAAAGTAIAEQMPADKFNPPGKERIEERVGADGLKIWIYSVPNPKGADDNWEERRGLKRRVPPPPPQKIEPKGL